MSRKLKDAIRFVVFLSAGLGILAWIFSRQNKMYQADCAIRGIAAEDCSLWVKLQNDFLSVDVFWVAMVLVAFMISNLSRAHRWQMLMSGIGIKTRYANAFWTIMFGYMANLAVPRIGEVLRGTMLARYEKQPVEKVLGTIVVDRAVDVVSLLFAIVLAFVLQYNVIYDFLVENFGESRLNGPIVWQLPLFGVIVVGFVTAVGGGTLRDIVLDVPVFWIADARYLLAAVAAALLTFLLRDLVGRRLLLLLYLDALGVALFAVSAVNKTLALGLTHSHAVVMGVITGIGGGIIRDLLTGRPTLIMSRDLYATPILLGVSVQLVLLAGGWVSTSMAALIGGAVILAVRAAAIRFHLQMPGMLVFNAGD